MKRVGTQLMFAESRAVLYLWVAAIDATMMSVGFEGREV